MAVIIGFLFWLLLSPLVLEIDTRGPYAGLKWVGIGTVWIYYDGEWWFRMRIFFYRKTMPITSIRGRSKRIEAKKTEKKNARRKMRISRLIGKGIRILKTCNVDEWELAIDTGDYTRNARFFPLNYLPYTINHLFINFTDTNYLVLKIRNRPLKLLYAVFRK